MPKRRSGAHDGRLAAKRLRRQHLYLVLDDCSSGYSIRKIDLSSDCNSDDDAAVDCTEQWLPPAVFRLEAPRSFPEHFTTAFGTKIMALHPWESEMETPLVPKGLVPACDVRTRAVCFYPRPKGYLADPIYIPVGDGVFVLSSRSFQLLSAAPRSWCKLSTPPFKSRHVTSYAVHLDGRTIFVSTKRRRIAHTFSVGTAQPFTEWKCRGDWVLPFTGRTHFDPDLDAWVGLSGEPKTTGYVRALNVVSANHDDSSDGRCFPSGKLCKEKLFGGNPDERQVGASLVYMGGGSKFCLVQCFSVCVDDEDTEEELGMERLQLYRFRLTNFSLKYDKKGDLTIGNSRQVRYYDVPDAATESVLRDIVAFWM
ncbi:hypothetical protein PR202_gb10921 [Eleusine coracana subsp. coracana]|uniref:DUF295 domain-containing protein n=1 Tax=Eleusine coracana subsp. coracana TaxID=191504 RepID=A0AAV5EKQ8_ELECO|nr:hypothetical protein PR202_gb10921 [Eleusine coracana subsp. coracana]